MAGKSLSCYLRIHLNAESDIVFVISEYALWLSGQELDEPRGYANLTEWFVVEGHKVELI